MALHFTVHPNMDRRSVLLFLGHRTPRASLGRVPCVNKTHLTTGPGSDLRRGRTGRAGNTAVRAADAELRAARLRADGVNASTRSSPGRRGSHTAGRHALQWCVEHVALGREITPSAGRQTTRKRRDQRRRNTKLGVGGAAGFFVPVTGIPPLPSSPPRRDRHPRAAPPRAPPSPARGTRA